jgi:hypothetical protein
MILRQLLRPMFESPNFLYNFGSSFYVGQEWLLLVFQKRHNNALILALLDPTAQWPTLWLSELACKPNL